MLALTLHPMIGAGLPLAAAADPKKILNGAQTYAGRNADSIGGYAVRRLLAGIGANALFSQPAGHKIFNYDPKEAARHFQYEVVDPSPDPTELRSAHARTHQARLQWAQELARNRLAWHSAEGLENYQRLSRKLISCNERMRAVWEETTSKWDPSLEPHERHVAFARHGLAGHDEIMKIAAEADECEGLWQVSGYLDLVMQLESKGSPLSQREEEQVREAMGAYEQALAAEQEYSQKLNAGEKGTNEYKRKKLEKVTYDVLQALHNLVRELYQNRFGNIKGFEAPLTFKQKTQSWFVGRGAVHMWGLEPFLETTWNLRREIIRMKQGKLRGDPLHEVGARLFGVQMMARYYTKMRIGMPPDFPAFKSRRPEEAAEIAGIEQVERMMASAASYVNLDDGVVASWPHTGPLDYNANLGLSYLLGMPWAAIIAEKAFRHIPILGPYLQETVGGFLDRKDPEAIYAVMADRLAEGLMVLMFPTGTREFDFPLVSPYADLSEEAILHLPGEYVPSRHAAAMLIKTARENKKPLMVVTANLSRGGIPEPNIPRKFGEFFESNNMFHYARPGVEDGFVAVADVLPYESFITPEDFPDASSFEINRLNLAIVMWREWMVGRQLDTGTVEKSG